MSKGLMDKILSFIGFPEEEEESVKAPEVSSPKEIKNFSKSIQRPELAAVPAARQSQIVSTQPRKFNDVQEIADQLKSGHPVIVNLSQVQPEEAQRILDYASGVSFALNGSAKKVNGEIFLFVPSGVDIIGAGDLRTFTKVAEPADEKIRWFKSETA
ncbi:cell division protein SepF [Desulforamulus ferrireducens]|uniref:Cell division protein SepF n=1 Tax=Desulforamulus ferrireducens TaxID=1833852 RepID=A0A1S6IVA4_9FIRM|nr:cell division protein SepF [Desulforamulus ferrireducens]AQS58719.1 cell division protein SepF [Desulforamulus ferrireducens]